MKSECTRIPAAKSNVKKRLPVSISWPSTNHMESWSMMIHDDPCWVPRFEPRSFSLKLLKPSRTWPPGNGSGTGSGVGMRMDAATWGTSLWCGLMMINELIGINGHCEYRIIRMCWSMKSSLGQFDAVGPRTFFEQLCGFQENERIALMRISLLRMYSVSE